MTTLAFISCTMTRKRKSSNWKCPGSAQKATTCMYMYPKIYWTRRKLKRRLPWRILSRDLVNMQYIQLLQGIRLDWRKYHKSITQSALVLVRMLGMRQSNAAWESPSFLHLCVWREPWLQSDRFASLARIKEHCKWWFLNCKIWIPVAQISESRIDSWWTTM